MKRTKRTIIIRKVEITTNKQSTSDSALEVCPLCHSPIHVIKPALESDVAHKTTDSLLLQAENRQDEREK